MSTTIRKCAVVCGLAAVVGLYATAAWRVELLRSQPNTAASCVQVHCVPHSATLSAVR